MFPTFHLNLARTYMAFVCDALFSGFHPTMACHKGKEVKQLFDMLQRRNFLCSFVFPRLNLPVRPCMPSFVSYT